MPRLDTNNANQKTDIFALGLVIYFMLKGYLPFPELDSWKDKLEIISQFKTKYFPALDNMQGNDVVKKYQAREYKLANKVVRDLEKITIV